MEVLGLTVSRLLIAVVFGILLAFVFTYATVSHPVEVPVQVITPVPTPPPVVIGNQPQQIPKNMPDLQVFMGDNMILFIILPIILFTFMFMMMSSSGGSASALMMIIISLIILGITMWVMRAVLDSLLIVASGLP